MATPKGLFSEYGLLSWEKTHYAFRKNDVQLWRTYFTCLHIPCVLHFRKHIVKMNPLACARGFIFDIEVDYDMTYFNRMLYHFKRNALVEGSTRFKEMHHSFSRESFKMFEHVLTEGFDPIMSISKSVLQIHWLPMVLHFFKRFFWKST